MEWQPVPDFREESMKTIPTIVRITPDVAELLASLRRPGESWSDVILRCARTEAEAEASEKPFAHAATHAIEEGHS